MAVSTIKSSGGDYTTLSAWEAAKQSDLTGNGPEEAECYDFALSDNFAVAGWTTTASDYIRVYTPASERHNGTSRDVSGSSFQIDAGGSVSFGTIRITEDYVRVEGLDITHSTASVPVLVQATALSASNDIRFAENVVHYDSATGSNANCIDFGAIAGVSGAIATVRNNICYGKARCIETRGAASIDLSFCTFYTLDDRRVTVIRAEADHIVKNVYAGLATGSSECFFTGGSSAGSNNASSDTTAETQFSSSLNSKAGSDQFVTVTAGSENLHLKAASALEAAGITVSGITTDIDGDTRAATPDIGADEFVAAAAGGRLLLLNPPGLDGGFGTGGLSL